MAIHVGTGPAGAYAGGEHSNRPTTVLRPLTVMSPRVGGHARIVSRVRASRLANMNIAILELSGGMSRRDDMAIAPGSNRAANA